MYVNVGVLLVEYLIVQGVWCVAVRRGKDFREKNPRNPFMVLAEYFLYERDGDEPLLTVTETTADEWTDQIKIFPVYKGYTSTEPAGEITMEEWEGMVEFREYKGKKAICPKRDTYIVKAKAYFPGTPSLITLNVREINVPKDMEPKAVSEFIQEYMNGNTVYNGLRPVAVPFIKYYLAGVDGR